MSGATGRDRVVARAVIVVAALLGPAGAAAQAPAPPPTDSAAAPRHGALPSGRWFEPPFADPTAPRFSVALMSTDLLAEQGPERPPFPLRDPADAAQDVVAAVSLGGILPLRRIASWRDGGMDLFVDGRVFARFRLEYPERDDMGQDWSISGGIDGRSGPWAARIALTHRSSHLGDEFVVETGAARIEFGSESLDLIAAREIDGIARVYAGGAWVFRSYLDWDQRLSTIVEADRATVQIGADRTIRPWPDRRFALHGGVDWQAAERTNWRGAFAAAVGAGIDSDAVAGRSLRIVARFFDGPSTMGQFFLTTERALSFELLATF